MGSRLNPIKNKLNDRESQMTVLSPVITPQRQEVLVGKWNPPPVTVIQALPALTSAEIIGQEASGPCHFHKYLRVDGIFVGMLERDLLEREIASPAPMAERHAPGRPVGNGNGGCVVHVPCRRDR